MGSTQNLVAVLRISKFISFNSFKISKTPIYSVYKKHLVSYFPVRFISETQTRRNMDNWKAERARYVSMPAEEKRTLYRCGSKYVTLDSIPNWTEYSKLHKLKLASGASHRHSVDENINSRVSIYTGDITALEIDAIVNAANKTLMGGGGVDGAIHRAAGPLLKSECSTLGGCLTGNAKITAGYELPAKYVIHTVGPIGEIPAKLKDCYANSLNVAKENNARSVAFPCISTGIYGYPNENAAHVALGTARKWLEDESNASKMERIIFCLFLEIDIQIYERLMMEYFPVTSN